MDAGVRHACIAASAVGLVLLLILTVGFYSNGVALGFEEDNSFCPPPKDPLGAHPSVYICTGETYGALTSLGWLFLALGIVGFLLPLIILRIIGWREGRPGPLAVVRQLLSH